MERIPGARQSKSRGHRGTPDEARSRSPSPAPASDARHARRRSRSPLRPRHERRDRATHGAADEDYQSSHRSKEHHHRHRRPRAQDSERDHSRGRDGGRDGVREKGQYSYRSSHHLDDLRTRRRQSAGRRRAKKEAPKAASPGQQPPYDTKPALEQVKTLSPTPSPPNVHTARFSRADAAYESSHRHHYLRNKEHSRSRSGSRHSSTNRTARPRRQSSAHSYASQDASGALTLPFGARTLSRWDFAAFEPLFAHYLELHKSLTIAKLEEDEVAGRWKSFIGKWNRGELPEGWYEPEMFLRVVRLRAIEEAAARVRTQRATAGGTGSGSDVDTNQIMTPPMSGTSMGVSLAGSSLLGTGSGLAVSVDDAGEDTDDDSYGPAPPPAGSQNHDTTARASQPPFQSSTTTQGPAIPSLQELAIQRELKDEFQAAQLSDLRAARKADRALQKERLDEILPRAEPGTRERQLEKRKLLSESMRAFREPSPDREVGDRELLGEEGGFDDYKRMLATMQRRKTEREVRREEITRARNAERDERLQVYREREESTMERLRELARQRFGAGTGA